MSLALASHQRKIFFNQYKRNIVSPLFSFLSNSIENNDWRDESTNQHNSQRSNRHDHLIRYRDQIGLNPIFRHANSILIERKTNSSWIFIEKSSFMFRPNEIYFVPQWRSMSISKEQVVYCWTFAFFILVFLFVSFVIFSFAQSKQNSTEKRKLMLKNLFATNIDFV